MKRLLTVADKILILSITCARCSGEDVGHGVHKKHNGDQRRQGAVQGRVQQLAGGDPAGGLPAGDQHPAYQPAHRHVQVRSHETSALSARRATHVDRDVRPCGPRCLSAATPSLRCKPTATSTGSFSATTWSCSTTPGPLWRHLLSSCPTLIFSSRGTSAKCPQSRSTTLVSTQPGTLDRVTWLLSACTSAYPSQLSRLFSVLEQVHWHPPLPLPHCALSQCCSWKGRRPTGWWRGKPFRRKTSWRRRTRYRKAVIQRGSSGCLPSERALLPRP